MITISSTSYMMIDFWKPRLPSSDQSDSFMIHDWIIKKFQILIFNLICTSIIHEYFLELWILWISIFRSTWSITLWNMLVFHAIVVFIPLFHRFVEAMILIRNCEVLIHISSKPYVKVLFTFHFSVQNPPYVFIIKTPILKIYVNMRYQLMWWVYIKDLVIFKH